MASVRINLLSEQKQRVRAERLFFAKLQSIALVLLVGYSVVLALLFGTYSLFQNRVDQLEARISDHTQAIESLYAVEAKQILLANKIALVQEYLDGFVGSREALTEFLNILPEGAQLERVVMSEEDPIMEMTVNSPDVFSFNEVMGRVQESINTALFQAFNMESVQRNGQAEYEAKSVVTVAEEERE